MLNEALKEKALALTIQTTLKAVCVCVCVGTVYIVHVCIHALECVSACSKDPGSKKRLSYTKHRCCLSWFNESERFGLRHLSKRVWVCVVLMFWMSIGGKTCVENPAELR